MKQVFLALGAELTDQQLHYLGDVADVGDDLKFADVVLTGDPLVPKTVIRVYKRKIVILITTGLSEQEGAKLQELGDRVKIVCIENPRSIAAAVRIRNIIKTL